jgi:hypothetical protein
VGACRRPPRQQPLQPRGTQPSPTARAHPRRRRLYQQEKNKLMGSRASGSLRASGVLPTTATRARPPALQMHDAALHAAMLPSPGSTNPSQLPSPSSPFYDSQRTTPVERPGAAAHHHPLDSSRHQRSSYGDEYNAAAARTPGSVRDSEERSMQVRLLLPAAGGLPWGRRLGRQGRRSRSPFLAEQPGADAARRPAPLAGRL